MVFRLILFSVLSASLSFLSSCSSSSSLTQGALTASASQNELNLERKTLELVNTYRKKNGLKSVKHHSGLSQLARGHSDFMADNDQKFQLEGYRVSHYGFQARSTLAQEKFSLGSVSENVAAGWGKGNRGVTGALQGWKNSKGHNRTMLGKQWDVSGVGVRVDSSGDVWITQLFAVRQKKLPRGVGPEILF